MLKRSARFLMPGGADATADGELALVCRSCPIPGVNLPAGWRDLINQSVVSYGYPLIVFAYRLQIFVPSVPCSRRELPTE
jgi:hypothetical protein